MRALKSHWVTGLFILLFLPSMLLLSRFHLITNKSGRQHKVDAFLSHAELTEYNESGQIKTQSKSTKAVYYHDDKSVRMRNPNISGYTKDRTPWSITAKHAKSTNGKNKVRFWDRVTLHQDSTDKAPSTTLKTKSLTTLPKESLAITHKKVTLKRPGIIARGDGAKANLKTGVVQLLSHADVTLAPLDKPQEGKL